MLTLSTTVKIVRSVVLVVLLRLRLSGTRLLLLLLLLLLLKELGLVVGSVLLKRDVVWGLMRLLRLMLGGLRLREAWLRLLRQVRVGGGSSLVLWLRCSLGGGLGQRRWSKSSWR